MADRPGAAPAFHSLAAGRISAAVELVCRAAPEPDRFDRSAWRLLRTDLVRSVAGRIREYLPPDPDPAIDPEWAVEHLVSRWADSVVRFLNHLAEDGALLERSFGVPIQGQPILRMRTGLSDPHEDGRTVIAWKTRQGGFYFKPRPGEVETRFMALLGRLDRVDPELPWRLPLLVSSVDHVWMSEVTSRRCGLRLTPRLGRRLGMLLGLLDLVQAADCHVQNLVVDGEWPVPVDLETLCHPTLPWESPALHQPEDPVALLRVGLLPAPVQGVDREWKDQGGVSAAGIALERLAPAIERGFVALYRSFQREDDWREEIDRFHQSLSGTRCRVLVRSTRRYREALHRSHAVTTASRMERERALEQALSRSADGRPSPVPRAIQAIEIGSLAALEIPRFTADPAGTALYGPGGESLGAVCLASGVERSRARLGCHGESDLAARRAVIRTALGLGRVLAAMRQPAADREA